MKEIIVESVLGYVNGCLKQGVALENWKVVKEGVLVYLVNEKIGVKLRSKLEMES
jgi:hypothetical protein